MEKKFRCMGLGVLFFIFIFFSGFVSQDAKLVNTQTLSLTGIESIDISYTSDDVTLIEGEGNQIVLKEYMPKNDKNYYAIIKTKDKGINIEAGKRPKQGYFQTYVEVYLPKSYKGVLSVGTASGEICTDAVYSLKELNVGSATGNIEFNDISADTINISSATGSIKVHDAVGEELDIGTATGNIEFNDVSVGAISISSASGSVTLHKAVGNMDIHSTSGNIYLGVSEALAFQFKARTTSGGINTYFDNLLTKDKKEHTVNGTIGKKPAITINLSTTSGGIQVDKL